MSCRVGRGFARPTVWCRPLAVGLAAKRRSTHPTRWEDRMIISHQHRFIFVKTLKTAGTSIEVFLSQHCGPLDIVTPILPHVEPHRPRNHEGYFNHISASEIRERVGPEIWDSYFKFCVERNPWDKTLSYFHMMNHRQGGGLTLERYLAGNDFPINHPKY